MPISFIVRNAVNDDAVALTAIHNAQGVATTASYALTPGTVPDRRAWLVRQHAARHPVLVAADGQGRIVGFADYDRFRSLPGYDLTVEHSVYTAPGPERLGIGAALMDQLIDRARSAGMHAMVGVIDADNAASIDFHQRLGFRLCGTLPQVGRKFDRWLDACLLVKLLDEH